jgi:hypothetical protein
MAAPINNPLTGDIWHLCIDDLLAPLPEKARLGGPGPFVINLSASSAPIDLPANPIASCQHAHVYQLQRIEDRRPRYRLRLGPFADEDEADTILEKVRDIYPRALMATADADDLRVIAAIQAKAGALPPAASASAATPSSTATPSGTELSSITATLEIPVLSTEAAVLPQPMVAKPVTVNPVAANPVTVKPMAAKPTSAKPMAAQPVTAQPMAVKATTAKPVAAQPMAVKATTAKPMAAKPMAAKAPVSPPPELAPSAKAEAVALTLTVAPADIERKPQQIERAPAPPPVEQVSIVELGLETTQTVRALTTLELQDDTSMRWFAIQLSLSEEAFDSETVPNLDIFSVYRLYCVAGIDQGRIMHALRLGFFSEETAASAVASYLADYYDTPTVKRVSAAERHRFADQGFEPRKDIGATGRHAVIEITNERFVRERRSTPRNGPFGGSDGAGSAADRVRPPR